MLLPKPKHTAAQLHAIQYIPLDSIVCDTNSFKQDWTTAELEAIGYELEEHPAPVIVQCIDTTEELYQILFGLKYFIAANLLGLQSIPTLTLQPQANTIQRFLDSTFFNWGQLDEIECAKAYEWLNSVCKYTIDEIAKMRKISRPVIGNQLRLLKLPHSVQRLLQEGRINKSICLLLLKLTDPKRQIHIAHTIVDEGLSVREAKTLIHAELPKPKEKNPLTIQVLESSIEISFESVEQREQILSYLKNFS